MKSQASWLLLLGLVSFTNSVMESTKAKPHVPTQESFVDQCTPVPTWTIGGERVVSLIGQNITVIALLNSSRPFGRQQAAMLNLLRTRFYLAGFPAINFMVINSMLASENTELLQHEAPSIPVYQELPGEPVKDVLGAGNDHILVLDRCGRMAYQVISPFSKLTHPYVKAAILSTYKDNPCGFCNITQSGLLIAQDTTQIFAYTGLAECKFKICHENFTNGDETNMKAGQLLQGVTQERENGLPHSFTLNTRASESQDVLKMHQNATSNLIKNVPEVKSPETRDRGKDEPVIWESEDIAKGKRPTIQVNSQLPKSEDVQGQLEVQQDYLRQIKNWDWSENQNQNNISGASMKSVELSVEVVHQENRSKEKKKKRKKKKHKEKGTHVNCASSECSQVSNNGLLQNLSGNSNSFEASDDSMEKLVNETQKLFDWYQQQIENGEEEYERTNILKVKIIDHYRKLLPWLNFKLAPKFNNSQV